MWYSTKHVELTTEERAEKSVYEGGFQPLILLFPSLWNVPVLWNLMGLNVQRMHLRMNGQKKQQKTQNKDTACKKALRCMETTRKDF